MKVEDLMKLTPETAEQAGGKRIGQEDDEVQLKKARERHHEALKDRRTELLTSPMSRQILDDNAFELVSENASGERDLARLVERLLETGEDLRGRRLDADGEGFLCRLLGTIPPSYVKKRGKTVKVRKDHVTLIINTGRKIHTYIFPKELFEDV